MILIANFDKLGLKIDIQLKNWQTEIFRKVGLSSDMISLTFIVIDDPKLVIFEVLMLEITDTAVSYNRQLKSLIKTYWQVGTS